MIKGQNWSNANYPLKQTKNNQIFVSAGTKESKKIKGLW